MDSDSTVILALGMVGLSILALHAASRSTLSFSPAGRGRSASHLLISNPSIRCHIIDSQSWPAVLMGESAEIGDPMLPPVDQVA